MINAYRFHYETHSIELERHHEGWVWYAYGSPGPGTHSTPQAALYEAVFVLWEGEDDERTRGAVRVAQELWWSASQDGPDPRQDDAVNAARVAQVEMLLSHLMGVAAAAVSDTLYAKLWLLKESAVADLHALRGQV